MSGANCKRRKRESAIAEGKKPLTTRESAQQGLGQNPRNQSDFEPFHAKMEYIWGSSKSEIFKQSNRKSRRLKNFLLTRSCIYEATIRAYIAITLDHLIVFFTVVPINIIFPLSVVYGIMA